MPGSRWNRWSARAYGGVCVRMVASRFGAAATEKGSNPVSHPTFPRAATGTCGSSSVQRDHPRDHERGGPFRQGGLP